VSIGETEREREREIECERERRGKLKRVKNNPPCPPGQREFKRPGNV